MNISKVSMRTGEPADDTSDQSCIISNISIVTDIHVISVKYQ